MAATHTFLITGTSSGLGLQMVLAALEANHKVLAATRDPQAAAAKFPMVEQHGGQWVKVDINREDTENVVENIVRTHNVDILVNNAAYALLGALEETSIDEFNQQIQTNLIGTVRAIKGTLPVFRLNGRGTIINIGSSSGFYGAPSCTAYSASKFAMEGLTEALAREIGIFGIRVLLVVPGAFRTDLVSNLNVPASKISDYEGTPGDVLVKFHQSTNGKQPGDPVKAAQHIVRVATDAAGEELANKGRGEVLRILLGKDCINSAKLKMQKLDDDISTQQEIAESTDYA